MVQKNKESVKKGSMPVVTKRKHTPQFKFDVALKALTSNQMAEVSRQYGVTTGLVSKWVTQVRENGQLVFEKTPDKERQELRDRVAKLEQLVGKKEVELSLMKNFMDFYDAQSGK